MSGERQREVSDVYNCVKDIEGFAGLETRHVPKYRVVVKFTKQPEKKLRYCTSNKRVFKSTGAALSLSDLENIVDIAKSELGATSISNEAFLSLSRNRVTVRVKKEDLKLAKMTLKSATFGGKGKDLGRSIRFETVSSLDTVESSVRAANSNIGMTRLNRSGGLDTGNICTTGFNVKFFDPSTGTTVKGGTTANHCGRQIRYESGNSGIQIGKGPDENLCWKGTVGPNSLQESTDIQWFTRSGDTYEGFIADFLDIPLFITRDVKGVLRSGDAIGPGGGWFPSPGTFVCMAGRTTRAHTTTTVNVSDPPVAVVDPRTGSICSFPARNSNYTLPAIGVTSKETCGVFESYDPANYRARAYVPGSTNPRAFTQGGDSGGPVYTFGFNNAGEYGVLAMGTVVGHTLATRGELRFSPIESFDALGLTVISSESP